jgi:hypothetical protein
MAGPGADPPLAADNGTKAVKSLQVAEHHPFALAEAANERRRAA